MRSNAAVAALEAVNESGAKSTMRKGKAISTRVNSYRWRVVSAVSGVVAHPAVQAAKNVPRRNKTEPRQILISMALEALTICMIGRQAFAHSQNRDSQADFFCFFPDHGPFAFAGDSA